MKPAYKIILLLSSIFSFTACLDEKGAVCLLTLDLGVEDVDADTKKITATASGGVGNYEYKWRNANQEVESSTVHVDRSDPDIGPGRYVFSVKDDTGCIVYDTVDISFPAICPFPLEIIVTGAGSEKTLTARAQYGIPPYLYHWSNGSADSSITIVNPHGDFSVTVTDIVSCEVTANENFSICPSSVLIDGSLYDVITIGTQCWTKQNLRTAPAGIPTIYDDAVWSQLSTPGAAYYNNDENMGTVYGVLFNGYAVQGGSLCPEGWHIPTDADWQTLIDHLGGDAVAGKALKADSDLWLLSNEESNESGFSALPGGRRQVDGSFIYEGSQAHFWSSTEIEPGSNRMWYRGMFAGGQNTLRIDWGKGYGFSCRCVRD